VSVRLSERARRLIVLIAAIATCVLTARLGVWQLDRAAQKIALKQAIEERAVLPPLPAASLAASADELPGQVHRRITLAGEWVSAATVFLDNRQMNGRVGFFVVTPLKLADGSAVLVQRGFVVRDVDERARLPSIATPPGPVSIDGRIAPPPARLYEFGGPDAGAIRQNLEVSAFARETRLVLRPLSVLQLDGGGSARSADGLQRDWPQAQVDVSRHHGYAFQWFALCALVAGLYVWFQIIQPRRRATAGAHRSLDAHAGRR
jgi:surfeit locus 1 family protein